MRSDRELMIGVRRGDEEAFEVLLERHRDSVRRRILGIVRRREIAEDLVQEVFMRLWTRADQWKGQGNLAAWLLRIASNLSLNFLRSEKRRPRKSVSIPPDDPDEEGGSVPGWMIDVTSLGPDAVYERVETEEILSGFLQDLPEEKREVMRLVHLENMDTSSVARKLGIPRGTVKSRIHHAIRHLATRWNEIENGQEVEQ